MLKTPPPNSQSAVSLQTTKRSSTTHNLQRRSAPVRNAFIKNQRWILRRPIYLMIVGRVSKRRVATRVIARKGMARLLLRRRDAGWKRARCPGQVDMMQRRQKSLVWRWLRRDYASLDKGRKILSPRMKKRNARQDRDSITYTRENTPTMAGNHHSRPKSTATHTYRWQQTQGRVTTMWSWLIMRNRSSSNVHKNSNGAYQTKFYKSLTPPNPTRS